MGSIITELEVMMNKIVSRILWVLAVSGLAFGSTFTRSNLPLAVDYPVPLSRVARAASYEQQSIYLPLTMTGRKLPTVFGVGLTFTPSGGMNQMAAARNYWLRYTVAFWSDIEPTKGTRNWSSLAGLETEVLDAHGLGMEMVFLINSTPTWAQKIPGYYCGPIKETELTSFASFMYDLVSRYSKPPYQVKYWEIGNEPDIDPTLVSPQSGFGCWGDRNDDYYGGGYYAEMLKVVYPEIKRADPQAQVIVGGLLLDCDPRTPGLCSGPEGDKPPKFLEGILRRNGANDGGNYFDGLTFHAYDYYVSTGHFNNQNWDSYWNTTGPVLIAKAGFIKEVLNNFGVTGKFLMNTESALLCGGSDDPPGGPGCESDPTSAYELTKADYLAQVYASAIAVDLRANVWFDIFGWRNSALLNSDLSPRPAYQAFATSRNILRDAHLTREIGEYDQVRGYEYTRDQLRVWVLWSLDGNNHLVNLDTMPTEIYDTLGEPVVPHNPLQVGYTPLYLVWNP
jgi:hypothetical protein